MSTILAERLADIPTTSTETMSRSERLDGVRQMLHDLKMLAQNDGCVAAAWAIEAIIELTNRAGASERQMTVLRYVYEIAVDNDNENAIDKIAEITRPWGPAMAN